MGREPTTGLEGHTDPHPTLARWEGRGGAQIMVFLCVCFFGSLLLCYQEYILFFSMRENISFSSKKIMYAE